jgi:serine/threonine protein kinase
MTPPGDGPSAPEQQPPGSGEDRIEELVATFLFHREEDPAFDLAAFVASQDEELREELARRCGELLGIHGMLAATRPTTRQDRPRAYGPYRVVRQIGRGAMAEVYLAVDERSDSQRAIKVLRVPAGALGRDEARFRREAQTLGKLRHPSIVTIHEVGEANGRLYIAMDYVPGRTLKSHLDEERARAAGTEATAADPDSSHPGPGETVDGLDAARAARLVADLAGALHAAHQEGVIHRDLKPDNVLVDEQGRPHLLDFGLARDMHEASISAEGDLAGTPYYMSPEAARGDRSELGPTADVFSLGVLLYELLTLRRPFTGEDLGALLDAIEAADPEPVREANPSVPTDLAAICHKALSRRPGDRYPSAEELSSDLVHFADHRAVSVVPQVTTADEPAAARRTRVWPLVAAALAGMVVVAAWVFVDSVRERALATEALDALPEASAVASLDEQELLATSLAARELAARRPWLHRSDTARLDALLTALDIRGRGALQSARQALERSDPAGGFMGARLEADRHLLTAALLLPEEEGVQALVTETGWGPLLSVTSLGSPGARLALRRLEPHHLTPRGPWEELGAAPLLGHRLPPDAWLVAARGADGAMAERLLQPDRPLAPLVVEAVPQQVPSDMLSIEGSAFSYGRGDGASPYAERRLALPAFRIDPRPVSRADFGRFLTLDGREPPPGWDGGSSDPDGPVTGVSWRDARDYATFVGRRLPSAAEWERAVTGREGDEAFAGTLREWTASPLVRGGDDGRWIAVLGRYLVKATGHDPGAPESEAEDARHDDLGFRTALSILP